MPRTDETQVEQLVSDRAERWRAIILRALSAMLDDNVEDLCLPAPVAEPAPYTGNDPRRR